MADPRGCGDVVSTGRTREYETPRSALVTDIYKTLRGVLLTDLEHECIARGDWRVEGYRVTRRYGDLWQIESSDGVRRTATSFERALVLVSKLVGNGV